MAMFVVHRKLTDTEKAEAATGVEAWFKANPRRKVCRAQIGSITYRIRKGHVTEDIETRR